MLGAWTFIVGLHGPVCEGEEWHAVGARCMLPLLLPHPRLSTRVLLSFTACPRPRLMQSVIDEKAVLQQRLEDAGTALDRSQAEAVSAVQAQAAAGAILAQVQAELEAAAREKAAAQAALSALQEEQGRTSASLTALQQEKGRVDAALGRLQRELAAAREERASAVAALAGASVSMPSHGWQGLCVRWGCNPTHTHTHTQTQNTSCIA